MTRPQRPDQDRRRQQPERPWLRDRLLDVAAILISCFCALVLAGEAESTGRLTADQTFFAVVAGCAASLTLWWRRTHPVAMMILVAPVGVFTDAAAYTVVALLYTLVVQRRGRAVAVMVTLSLVTAAVYSWRRPDPELPLLGELMITAGFIVVTIAVAVAVRFRHDLIESLRQRAEQAESHARLRAERLRALERERIAREMHDALAHRISMVSLHAGALQIRPDLTGEGELHVLVSNPVTAATSRVPGSHAGLLGLSERVELVGGRLRHGLRADPYLGNVFDLEAWLPWPS